MGIEIQYDDGGVVSKFRKYGYQSIFSLDEIYNTQVGDDDNGLMFIQVGHIWGIFMINFATLVVTQISAPSEFSLVKDTPGKINVYYDIGYAAYVIQNKYQQKILNWGVLEFPWWDVKVSVQNNFIGGGVISTFKYYGLYDLFPIDTEYDTQIGEDLDGMMYMQEVNGELGLFRIQNTGQSISIISAPSIFSLVKDTPGKINVYWDSNIIVQNKYMADEQLNWGVLHLPDFGI